MERQIPHNSTCHRQDRTLEDSTGSFMPGSQSPSARGRNLEVLRVCRSGTGDRVGRGDTRPVPCVHGRSRPPRRDQPPSSGDNMSKMAAMVPGAFPSNRLLTYTQSGRGRPARRALRMRSAVAARVSGWGSRT